MGVNYEPEMNSYKKLGDFKFWCQKVLPAVYDDSLSYYELLCKVVNYVNELINNNNLMGEDLRNLYGSYIMLQSFVNNYFDNLDVQDEINNKLDEMVRDGTFARLIKVWFVTPEQYGAVGDGVADDTNAIISSFESGLPVVLSKKYKINRIAPPINTHIIVNGTLDVYDTININYPNIKFTGSGKIRCYCDVCFKLEGAGTTGTTYCKGFYIGDTLDVEGFGYSMGRTAFLITATDGIKSIVVYPTINCHINGFKYGIHSKYEGSNIGSWFTALNCNALIESCRYAVHLDWQGNGSIFRGVIQPIASSGSAHTDDNAVVRITDSCTFESFIWDMSTAINKYSVEIKGTNNYVNSGTTSYMLCEKFSQNNIIGRAKRFINVATPTLQGGKLIGGDIPFDNTNDMAKNAGNNKVSLSVTPSNKLNSVKSFLKDNSLVWYPEVTDEDIVLEFNFPSAVGLRQVFLCGEKMPLYVNFEYLNTSGEWVQLKRCELDKDYTTRAGTDSFAWWQYTWSNEISYSSKFASGLRITFRCQAGTSIKRIYIGVPDVTSLNKYGDDIIATTMQIKGTDGAYYKIKVQDGALVVEPA